MFTSIPADHLQKIFNSFLDMVFLMKVEEGPNFRYVTANETALKLSGVTADSFGKRMDEILPETVFVNLQEAYEMAYRTKVPYHYEIETYANDIRLVGETILTPILNDIGECTHILAAVRDVTNRTHQIRQQKEMEAQLKGQKRIFELIATDTMLEEILEVTAKTLEGHINDVLCTVHLYSKEKNVLTLVTAPSINDEYAMQLSEMVLGADVSGCGRAAVLKEPVVIADIEEDPLIAHLHHFFSEHKINAYWVMPILSSEEELLGIVTVYSLKQRIPSEADERLIKMYTDLAVLAIEQKQTKEALKESEARFRIINENMLDLIVMLDPKGKLSYVSPSYRKIFGKTANLGNSFLVHIHEDDREIVMTSFKKMIETKSKQDVECRYKHDSGEYIVIEARGVPVLSDSGHVKQVVVVARDITERKRTEETVKKMAYQDTLTGLANRRKFQEDLDELIEIGQRKDEMVGVLFLDMDRFKIINDSLGHAFGDRVLKVIAAKLSEVLSGSGKVYRMSGDEFTVLVPGVKGTSDIVYLAQDILAIFEEPLVIDEHEFRISTSIGMALYPEDGEDAETLLIHSDMAMYRAKEKGRNSFQFYKPSLNLNQYDRLVLENDLHKAIENNEFILHYQPRLDVSTKEIVALEALVRWNHPKWGILSPGEFIPLAEESGLIVQIDNWVLEHACRQNKRWQEKGLKPIRMAVNFSARQFLQRQLAAFICQVLDDTGMDGEWLEIEITESTLMKYEDSIIQSLEKLHKMGVRIAIDDFGTGYSSLSYLKKFQVHSLKIDQSFVKGIANGSDEAAISSAVIMLGHSLKMRVVAEGVESAEQFAFLKEQCCNEVQGFHFYRPMGQMEVEEILQSHRVSPV